MNKNLSIFIDESGDFGFKDGASECYLLTFVLHDQKKDISDNLRRTEKLPVFHGGPLIRRESPFDHSEEKERQRIFRKFSAFVSFLPIMAIAFQWKKKEFHSDNFAMEATMARKLNQFLMDNHEYLDALISLSSITIKDRIRLLDY